MKNHIITILSELKNENITGEQCAWEFSQYEIQKFSISFSKEIALKL